MRVTNNMMVSNMMRNLNNNLSRLDRYQNQLATGKKIRYASDDPVIASRALKLRTDLSELEQYEKNTNDALSWLEITESAVADVGDVLQRARELAVQAASGTTTTEDKQKISAEMEQLKKQLISSGNTTYAGRYIFSGYNTDEKLLDEDGNYNIDITTYTLANKPSTTYEIGIGDDIQVSTNGIDIFGYEDINPLLGKLPYSESTIEDATQAELKASSSFDLTFNFTAGLDTNAVQITIDGTVFTVNDTDLGALDGRSTAISKDDILNVIKDAEDGSSNKLSDKADIYFDSSGNLQIKSKSYGVNSQVQVDFTAGTGVSVLELETVFGITNGTNSSGTEASIESKETLTDAEVTNAVFQGTELLVNFNGDSKRVTIGTLPTDDIDGLVTAINTALDSAYPPGGKIVTSKVDQGGGNYSIKFTTNTSAGDPKPNLNVDVVRAKESTLIQEFENVIAAMNSGDEQEISDFLEKVDIQMDKVLSVRADIGARVNRMELVKERISADNLSFTKLLSQNEDVDMAEVIMKLQNEENVYRASLSVGAKVIQPTLIDFIR